MPLYPTPHCFIVEIYHSWLHAPISASRIAFAYRGSLRSCVSYLMFARFNPLSNCSAGKSSISKVVFSKMAPHETLFLEPSAAPRVYTIATNPYMQFAVWDWPGDYEWARGPAPGASGGVNGSLGSYIGSASMPGGSLLAGSLSAGLAHSVGAGSMASRGGHMAPGGAGGSGGGRDAVSLSGMLNVAVFDDPQDELEEGMPGAPPTRLQAVSELDALNACAAIVFVIDATALESEPPHAELRRMGAALMALARRKAAAAAMSRAAGPAASAASAAAAGAATGIPGSTPSNPYALPSVEVFLHKVDGDSSSAFGAGAGPEARTELLRDVATLVGQELADAGFAVSGLPTAMGIGGGSSGYHSREVSHGGRGHSTHSSSGAMPIAAGGGGAGGSISGPVPLSAAFHVTSIHDHSVFEALSRVVQKVTPGPQLMPSCENLLNGLQAAVGADKVFLLDVVTKLYFASDSSPVQESTYELCGAMIEVVNDVAAIYDPSHAADAAAYGGLGLGLPGGDDGAGMGGDGLDGPGESLAEALGRKTPPNGPSGTFADGGVGAAVSPSSAGAAAGAGGRGGGAAALPEDAGRCSISLIRLSDGSGLYMREVSPNLAVVAVIKDRSPAEGGHAGGRDGDWDAADDEDSGLGGPRGAAGSEGDALGAGLEYGGDGAGDGGAAGAGRASAGAGGSARRAGGGAGGGGSSGPAYIPRSGLSFPDRALVDYNIRVFAGALAKIFALKLGIGAAELAAAGAFLPASMTSKGGVSLAGGGMSMGGGMGMGGMGAGGVGSYMGAGGSMMPPGSFGGLPLSSSLSKSSYQGSSMMTRAAASSTGAAGGAPGSFSPSIMIGGGGAGGGGGSGFREPVGSGGGAEIEFGSPRRGGPSGADLLMASRGR